MERTVDLCIVGASGAGMSAAIVAKQKGIKSVLVLEKMAAVGGCTKMSAGTMGINTPVQRRFGIKMDVDEAFEDLMQVLNWHCDAKLVRKWLNASGENFEWLEDLGLTYNFVASESADVSRFRNTHHRIGKWNSEKQKWEMIPQGPILTKCLKDNCEKYGAEIILKTRAKHLIKDDDGKISGVIAESPDGELVVHAKAVILATGSISANAELVAKFYNSPEYKNIHIMSQVPHNTGDGLIMAEEVGGVPGGVGTLFIGPHNHFPHASETVGMFMRRPHPIKVNKLGERFVNEGLPFEEFGWMQCANVDMQPGKVCYILMDQKYIDTCKAGKEYLPPRIDDGCMLDQPPVMFGIHSIDKGKPRETWRERIDEHWQYEVGQGHARICDTLEEVAEFIGCPVERLRETVDNYNDGCHRGYDPEFLKRKEFLFPVEQAPYYVIRGESGIDTCLGGLKINNHQQVVDKDGDAIPGLYAAGVMCSGWFNNLYAFFGSEMSFTLYSGRAAAAEVAASLTPAD